MLPLLRKKLAMFDELDKLQQQKVKPLKEGEQATFDDYKEKANTVTENDLWKKAVECSNRIEKESKPKLFKEVKSSLFFRRVKVKKCLKEIKQIVSHGVSV